LDFESRTVPNPHLAVAVVRPSKLTCCPEVLVDADIVRDAKRFHMDLVHLLERTLHGKVKPSMS
jgi:hypothetical protein